MSWPKVKLGDCCDIVSGATPKTGNPDYWGGDIPWVSPKSLSKLENKYLDTPTEYITQAGFDSCSTRILPAKSLLLSCRAPVGLTAINREPICTNQGFKSLIPNPEMVDINYLFHVMREMRPRLEAQGRGATFTEVSKSIVERFEIPLPPLDEQRRIAAILDKASEISQNTEQAFEKREGLKNSVFIELFGDPLNTSQWQKVSFLDGVQDVTRSQSKIPQKEFLESGVLPIIDQGRQNIGGWTNDPSLVCTVPLPNIIFGDHTGVLKFLDFPYALGADGVKVLIPKDLNFEPFFLYHLLRFLPLPDVGYSRHYKFLKQFMLICPPIQLQRKFERIVNSINQIPESAGLAKENAQSILQEMLT
ncbi:restriction endonuclease subunit S [Candidatus Poseidonia alphae]|nr:restriction endonuclease subunit S [Candidatus Poseidonia alphae]